MRYLVEPAVQLMNRLKYAYKFSLVGVLIILQASVLIYMLVSELNKNIDFAIRERIGVKYIQALTHLLNETQNYRSIHYGFSTGNSALQGELLTQQKKIDAALDAVAAIDNQASLQMDTTWKLQMLQNDWLARKKDALQFTSDAERAQVLFDLDSRWLTEVTDFMMHVGYESNLAMDSDFATSRLVDSVLRKLPGLIDSLSTTQALAIQLQDNNLSPESKYRLLQTVGLARSGMEQTDHNTQLVFRNNETIKTKLKTLHTALTDAVPIFAWNIEQKTIGQQGLPIPQQLLTDAGNQAIQTAVILHKEELNVIDQLLVARVDKYLQYRNLVVCFTGGILLLVCYLFLGFDMSVRKAVYRLDKVMTSAGNGDLNVRGAIDSRDEMGSLTYAINNMLDSLQKMVEEVQLSHAKLEVWNQELEQKVAERTASLRNLLDHAGQGFLSFGEDLRINDEYSAECKTFFHREIAKEAVPVLIYPEDRDQQVFLEAIFKKIMQADNAMMRETYFSLLPEEIVLGSNYIGVAYKLIDHIADPSQRKIMLILTDKTLQRAMEDQVQSERDILAMIVYVVTHSADFFAAMGQYTSFCQEGMQKLLHEKKPADEMLATLFRTVHTFKGAFGQLRMSNTVAKLHDMEGMLDSLRSNKLVGAAGQPLAEKLNAFTPQIMLDWLNPDLDILKDKLGEVFFQRGNMLVVDNNRLLEIEEKVLRMLSPTECSLLLPYLRRLRYKPLKELLQSYPEYVITLAEQNEKAVYPFEIEGSETLVDPLQYYDFIKSLGHVFRNSIVHGIESYDERVEFGKAEIGRITCEIQEDQAGITLVISDDGRGMDPDRIRDIALEKGICTPEQARNLQEKELIQLIFADGFSSAQAVDTFAGRGVGLSAVRAELEKLNGSVHVNTSLGKGTQFQFFLPVTLADGNEPYSIRQLAKPLVNAAESLLLSDAGLQVRNRTYNDGTAGGKLNLRKVTTFLGIKGIANGRMVLSADQSVVLQLIEKRFAQEAIDSPIDRMMEATLSHYAAEIFQHALKSEPTWLDSIKAEALVSILADDASAKYPQSETPTWLLDTDAGKITLSLIY